MDTSVKIKTLEDEHKIMNKLITELYTFMRAMEEDKVLVALTVRKRIDDSVKELKEFRLNTRVLNV